MDGINQLEVISKYYLIVSKPQCQVLLFSNIVSSQAIKNKINETLDQQQVQVDYIPVTLDDQQIAELEPESVYFLDLRKVNSTNEIKYYMNLVADFLLKCCLQCGHFFLLD